MFLKVVFLEKWYLVTVEIPVCNLQLDIENEIF